VEQRVNVLKLNSRRKAKDSLSLGVRVCELVKGVFFALSALMNNEKWRGVGIMGNCVL